MVIIPLLLVFLGFFSVFFSSFVDLLTTYLPERLVKLSIPVGLVGWLVQSAIMGDFSFFLKSLAFTSLSFAAGGILYYTKHWASGDMWLMAVACSLLGPAFPNFWPDFFIYAVVWSGVLGVVYFLFYFIRAKLYKDYAYLVVLNIAMAAYSFFSPYMGLVCLSISFLLLLLFSRKKIEDLFIVEKKVKELEEDDWLTEDLKVGKYLLKASKPVGKSEVRLAQKYGKGKVKIKSGVPMTPAFSLSLITLLVSSF